MPKRLAQQVMRRPFRNLHLSLSSARLLPGVQFKSQIILLLLLY